MFICSAWKHHLKEIEHRQQLMDIIILSKIISENIIVKIHPRDKLEYYKDLECFKNIKVGYFEWNKILNKNNIFFSNLSTCLIELYNSDLNVFSLMISFKSHKYSNTIISDERVNIIETQDRLKDILYESK